MFKGKLAYNSGRFPTKIKHVRVPAYEIWRHMVVRCWYTKEAGNKRYSDVFVSDDWLDYSNYYQDVVNMIGYNLDGFVLDKDILSGDVKVYSRETCCFVPHEINVAFTKSDATRGEYLIGVDFHKKTGKFRARHQKHLGFFDTEMEAYLVYKEAKEKHLKDLAEKYKEVVDPRAYEALLSYKVEITD